MQLIKARASSRLDDLHFSERKECEEMCFVQ